MTIHFIPCRHQVTGAETELPETALQHMPAWEPTEPADRERLGYTDQPSEQAPADEEPPAAPETTTKNKSATRAAKTPKE